MFKILFLAIIICYLYDFIQDLWNSFHSLFWSCLLIVDVQTPVLLIN